MKLIFSQNAWNDYLHWQKNDQKVLKRINQLITEIQHSPSKGIGKPERLKYALAGYWSRRINNEQRIVYRTDNKAVFIAQLRYHY